MANIKLSDYCKKNGISYITGYRWFKDGKLPVKATQTDSGTILVEDDSTPTPSAPVVDSATDAASLFLKKTLEYSKNNSSIEDFAAYIFSNFKLKLYTQDGPLPPKYTKIKPKSEDVQDHFKKILNNTSATKEKPAPNMYIPDPKTWESISGDSLSKLESTINNGETNVLQSNYSTLLTNNIHNGGVQSNLLAAMGGGSFGASGVSFCATPAPDSFGDPSGTYGELGLNNYFINSPEVESIPDIESSIIGKPKRGRPKKITRTE